MGKKLLSKYDAAKENTATRGNFPSGKRLHQVETLSVDRQRPESYPEKNGAAGESVLSGKTLY